MIILNSEITKCSYALEIEMKAFLLLLYLEKEFECDLLEELTDMGAFDIEWNGHFGNYIFFSLDQHDEMEERLKNIKEHIEWYLTNEIEDNRQYYESL